MNDRPDCIVDLDRKFAEDPDGKTLHEVRNQLDAAASKCREALDAGVGVDEAKRLGTLLAAFSAALNLLPVLWQAQQERI